MNKANMLIMINLVIAVVVLSVVLLLTTQDSNDASSLITKKNTVNAKQLELNQLKTKEKITDISLIKNISLFKDFVKVQDLKLKLTKVKKNDLGMQYFLTGNSIDVLILAYRALQQKLKIYTLNISFDKRNNAILDIIVLGV